jgi:alpha-ketoglutarate-dependent taurine dioxygenase
MNSPAPVPSVDHAIAHARRFGLAICDLQTASDGDVAQQVSQMAARLGAPYGGRGGAMIECLSPTQKPAAARNSLSARYGMSAFPWHTDTAHFQTPARWVIMACVVPGEIQASTEIMCRADLKVPVAMAEICSTAPFAFVNGRESFLSTIVQMNRGFIRFDPGCMQPLNRPCERVLMELANWVPKEAESLRIDWCAGRAIIFDNWNYLHRRHDASSATGRKLLRAYAA